MAQIDLASSTLEILDGFAATAKVNQPTTAPANGDTTLTIDTFTGIIPVGVPFTVVGATGTYTVTAHTETSSNTTGITFTPPLSTAAGIPVDNANITFGPRSIEIKIGEGTMTWEQKQAFEYVRNKRLISFVRHGDQQPLSLSFQFVWEFITSADSEPITPYEALTQTGAASSWVSSGLDSCEPFSVDIRVTYLPPCSGVKHEVITFKELRVESYRGDLKGGTVDVSGNCKVAAPVFERVA